MAGWKTLSGPLGATITDVDTTKKFQFGTCVKGEYYNSSAAVTHFGEFTYQQGVASCAAGSWVALNPDNSTVSLLADGHLGGVGVATAATVASTYGWFQIKGKAVGLLAASVADNAGLYTTATAGTAGATASGQSEIIGARAAAASGSSAANTDVELNYPVCGLSAGA